MTAITTRHNKIVDRLTAAVGSGSNGTTDQTVCDSGSTVRRNIVIDDQNHVTIIDVCCPFDNGEEALEEAVARKELKYEHLKTHFESLNKTCSVFGFAIGALGILRMSAFSLHSTCRHDIGIFLGNCVALT